MDRTGQTLLGKYELTRVLGKGGMGEVWEGEHTLTGRKVAVKILAENYLANRKVVARFGREARAASSVNHTGIVEILDQDRTDDGVPFLVMEFLEGESVGERIRKLGKLTQDEALAIILPLLDALDAAHQAGVVHRDLKPDNVFILPGARGEERIKILDFGISQKADEIEHGLTQEGSVLGTPHYMSPEQARGEAGIDARVDVYATGVMFYECVVGDVPFDAGNYNALLQIILGTPPPSPRSRGADISPAVEQVLLAAMDKKRDRRPPNARVFHDLLLEASVQDDDAFLDTKTWTFSMPSEPPPPLEFADEATGFGDETTGVTNVAQFSAPPPSFDGGFEDDAGDDDFTQIARSPREALEAKLKAAPAPKVSAKAPPPAFDEGDELEADLFSAPRITPRSTPHSMPNRFESLRPDQRPLVVPPPGRGQPPPPAFEGSASRSPFDGPGPARGGDGPRQFEAPMPSGARPSPFEAPQRPPVDPSPTFQRPAAFDPAPRMNSNRPGAERKRVNFTSNLREEGPTLGRTIVSWVAVLAAIAALVYLVRVISDRPDPRKRKRTDTEQGAEAAQAEGEATPAAAGDPAP